MKVCKTMVWLILLLVSAGAASCGGKPFDIEERQSAIVDGRFMASVNVSPLEMPGPAIHRVDIPMSGIDYSMGILSLKTDYQQIFWHAYNTSNSRADWIINTHWPYYPVVPSELSGDLSSGFSTLVYNSSLAGLYSSRTVNAGTCNGVTFMKPSHLYYTGGVINFGNNCQMLHAWHNENGYQFSTACGPMYVNAEYHYEWIVMACNAGKYGDTAVPDPNYSDNRQAYRLNADGTFTYEGFYQCLSKVVKSPTAQVHYTINSQDWHGDTDGTRFCVAPGTAPAGYPNAYMSLTAPFGKLWLRAPEKLRHARVSDISPSNCLAHVEPGWTIGSGIDTDNVYALGAGVMAFGNPPAGYDPWHVYELDFQLQAFTGFVQYYGWMADDGFSADHFWNYIDAPVGGP